MGTWHWGLGSWEGRVAENLVLGNQTKGVKEFHGQVCGLPVLWAGVACTSARFQCFIFYFLIIGMAYLCAVSCLTYFRFQVIMKGCFAGFFISKFIADV